MKRILLLIAAAVVVALPVCHGVAHPDAAGVSASMPVGLIAGKLSR